LTAFQNELRFDGSNIEGWDLMIFFYLNIL
jgi:hypothetical protein